MRDIVGNSASAQAREDVLAMTRQMGPTLGVLVVLYFLGTMAWLAAPIVISTWLGAYLIRMLLFMGLAFAGAPFTRGLYRFVALGETKWPTLGRFDDATRRFACYASLMTALYFVPPVGREIVVLLGGTDYADLSWFVLCGVVWWFVIRATTLLPMAAIDPERTSFREAFAHSKVQLAGYFFATTAPAAPAFIALIVLTILIVRGAMHAMLFYPLAVGVLLAIQLLPLAVSTRLYLAERRQKSETSA